MADVLCLLVGLVRKLAANPEEIEVPKRSETLESWCLPMLASSLKAEEQEAEALALFKSVEKLAEKQKQKEQAKHDGA